MCFADGSERAVAAITRRGAELLASMQFSDTAATAATAYRPYDIRGDILLGIRNLMGPGGGWA